MGDVAILGRVKLGKNVVIWNHVVIQDGTELGDDVKIGSFADIGKDVKIGDGTWIQCHVSIPNRAKIGKGVLIGPQTFISNDRFPPAGVFDPVIEDDVVIGGNCSIVTKRIGRRAVIGAGSVVTKDVPSGEVWAGNPARFLYKRDEYDRRKKSWRG